MYFNIKGVPVYMGVSYTALAKKCGHPFPPKRIIGLPLSESESKEENNRAKAVYEYLLSLRASNSDELESYAHFHIDGDQVKYHLYDILYDYCCYSKCFDLWRSKHDFDSFMGNDSYFEPLGEACYLGCKVKYQKMLDIFRKKPLVSSFLIVTNNIISIDGKLNDFKLEDKAGNIIHLSNRGVSVMCSKQ